MLRSAYPPRGGRPRFPVKAHCASLNQLCSAPPRQCSASHRRPQHFAIACDCGTPPAWLLLGPLTHPIIQSHPPKGGIGNGDPPLIFPSIDDREGEGGYQTADGLPEFQGPKYRGSFRRGDFADFHQRFSLVPRRCAGKYPPAAREIRADSWAPSIRVAQKSETPTRGPPPPTESVIYAALGLPPPGGPPRFPYTPQSLEQQIPDRLEGDSRGRDAKGRNSR